MNGVQRVWLAAFLLLVPGITYAQVGSIAGHGPRQFRRC